MPITFAQLKGAARSLKITFADGEEMNVKYYPSALSPFMQDRLMAMEDGVPTSDHQIDIIQELLYDWDIVEGGKKVPITRENISKVPYLRIGELVRQMFEDTAPKGTSSPVQGDISPQVAPPVNSTRRTRSSKRRAT